MFSSGRTGYSIPASARLHRISTQEEQDQAKREREAAQQAYNHLIKQAATNMFYHPEQFKKQLEEAITAYLEETKDKLFRDTGRKYAEELKTKITQAKTTGQLILALNSVINKGSEEKDSLKTFIFSSINENFCDKKLSYVNFSRPLNKIIAEIMEMKMLREKSLLCWAGFRSKDSNFNRLPPELITNIVTKLNCR